MTQKLRRRLEFVVQTAWACEALDLMERVAGPDHPDIDNLVLNLAGLSELRRGVCVISNAVIQSVAASGKGVVDPDDRPPDRPRSAGPAITVTLTPNLEDAAT